MGLHGVFHLSPIKRTEMDINRCVKSLAILTTNRVATLQTNRSSLCNHYKECGYQRSPPHWLRTQEAFPMHLFHRFVLASACTFCVASSQLMPCTGGEPTGLKRPFTDESLKQLPLNIQELSIRGNRGYGNDVVTDNGIPSLHRYKELRILHGVHWSLTDTCLETIGQLPALEELSLDSNKITGKGLHHLLGLKKLRKLNLDFNPLDESWPDVISQIEGLVELRAISSVSPVTDDALTKISRLSRLTILHLHENTRQVTDTGLEAVSKLSNLTFFRLQDSKSRIADCRNCVL